MATAKHVLTSSVDIPTGNMTFVSLNGHSYVPDSNLFWAAVHCDIARLEVKFMES